MFLKPTIGFHFIHYGSYEEVYRLAFVILAAYMFTRPRKKDTGTENHRKASQREVKERKAEEEVPAPPIETTPIYETLMPPSLAMVPVKVREPIPEDQQRELFMWMLEEKRKIKPRDREEKKRIDEDKAILKQFIRAKPIPRF